MGNIYCLLQASKGRTAYLLKGCEATNQSINSGVEEAADWRCASFYPLTGEEKKNTLYENTAYLERYPSLSSFVDK